MKKGNRKQRSGSLKINNYIMEEKENILKIKTKEIQI